MSSASADLPDPFWPTIATRPGFQRNGNVIDPTVGTGDAHGADHPRFIVIKRWRGSDEYPVGRLVKNLPETLEGRISFQPTEAVVLGLKQISQLVRVRPLHDGLRPAKPLQGLAINLRIPPEPEFAFARAP